MSNSFNVEKFKLLSTIMFNIFPKINYVTLNNSFNGKNTNYYIKIHDVIKEHKIYENNHFEFIGETKYNTEDRLYLKNIGYSPKTTGTYIIERTKKTNEYELNLETCCVKFLPLMEFCNFDSFHFISNSHQIFYFVGFNCRLAILYDDINVIGTPCRIEKNQMKSLVKMAMNGEEK